MRKLAAWCHDRRRTVIGLWVGAFLVLAVLWGTAAGTYVNKFNLPGTESQRTYDLLRDRFPQQAGDTGASSSPSSRAACSTTAARSSASRAEIAKSPEVEGVGDPLARARRCRKDGSITFAQIQFRKASGDDDPKAIKTMAENTLKLDGKGGVQVALGGDTIHWATAQQGGAGECFGILVAGARAVPHARARRDVAAAAQRAVRDGHQPRG